MSWIMSVSDLIAFSCFLLVIFGLCERHLRSGGIFSWTWRDEPFIRVILPFNISLNTWINGVNTRQNMNVVECSINEWAFTFSFDLDSSGWLTHVVETANAHFQVKTNLQDALSGDIHYKLMQRSKNRNKTGYLSHCPTHTQTHTSQATWYTQTHTLIMTTWINCPLDLFLVSFCAIRVRHGWKRTLVLNVPTPCTVWAEEAATWWTPSVIFRRRTSGRRRATKHVGWAWSLKRDPNTSRLLIIF